MKRIGTYSVGLTLPCEVLARAAANRIGRNALGPMLTLVKFRMSNDWMLAGESSQAACAGAMGLALSAGVKSVDAANALAPALLIVLILFGGFYVSRYCQLSFQSYYALCKCPHLVRRLICQQVQPAISIS